jgi:hypothetical protein
MASGNDKSKLHGFYRSKVIDNKDTEFFGRVKVWIPDIMPKVNDTKGLWALPANNFISGLNSDGDEQHQYAGSCLVPPKGSWVWVFFENENPNKPYYFSGINLKNTKILPECQLGSNPEKKWVLYKSHAGRSIVISDDPDDERVQITGKKRLLTNPPTGDTDSVSTIQDNQTTILLSEIEGKQQLLIQTYKGDFIKIDIDKRTLTSSFKSTITEITEDSIIEQADVNIEETAGGNITEDATGDISETAGGSISETATSDISETAGGNISNTATGDITQTATGDVTVMGSNITQTAAGQMTFTATTMNMTGTVLVSTGATGSFVSLDGKMVTVVAGIVVAIAG